MYLSRKSHDDELDEYGDPVVGFGLPIKLSGIKGVNYQPISARSDIEIFGENATGVYKALLTTRDWAYHIFTEDNVGDVVYINGASPFTRPIWDKSRFDVEPINGYWANYEVNAVRTYNLTKHVYFVKYKASGVV